MQPKITIVYLCYGMRTYLREIVDAVAKLDYPKDRLTFILVPAGSPDGIADVIRAEVLPRSGQDLPEVVLLDDGQNHGFAGNNNLALRYALEKNFDYAFLHNGDLKLAPDSLTEAVRLAEASPEVGSVQCLVRYWQEQDKVNVTGGVIHIAGYGFARDNGKQMSEIMVKDGEDIAYASGAAVLYRVSALQKVGLLEEGFFMYHEDLELGMRLRFAGYRNILAAKSFAFHDYKFSRNPKKFAWMELYRNLVVLAYYKPATLFLFSPLLVGIELGTWLMALKGGWIKAKFWAFGQWFYPRTWKLLWSMRKRAQSLRVIKDADFLKFVVGKIEAQEIASPLMDKLINPAVDEAFQAGRRIVKW
ncbi:MAG: glycosyltransferase family 2 protein [Patescibacteria group bacterium]